MTQEIKRTAGTPELITAGYGSRLCGKTFDQEFLLTKSRIFFTFIMAGNAIKTTVYLCQRGIKITNSEVTQDAVVIMFL